MTCTYLKKNKGLRVLDLRATGGNNAIRQPGNPETSNLATVTTGICDKRWVSNFYKSHKVKLITHTNGNRLMGSNIFLHIHYLVSD